MKIAYVTLGIFLVGINAVTLWFLNRRADMIGDINRASALLANERKSAEEGYKRVNDDFNRASALLANERKSAEEGYKLMIDDFNKASALLANERKSAEEGYKSAMDLARKARSEGNFDLALTYAVNAIGHRGNGVECFRMYFDIVTSSAEQTPEWKIGHFDRLEKLIAGSIASVDVDDVEGMIRLAGEVREANDAVTPQISEDDEESESVLKKEEIAHNKMTELLEHVAVMKKKMEGDVVNKELYVGMIRSDYQSIDVLYSALIGEDDVGMDKGVVDECGKLYRGAKQAAAGFEQCLSKPHYDAIVAEVKKITNECWRVTINGEADGHITEKLKEVNRRIADVRTKMLKITDEVTAQKATALISGDLTKCLDELSQKRMESYQQFAIRQISAAAEIYDEKGKKWDDDKKDDAMRRAWSHLRYVSPSLLVPEVSEFYTSVWNKLFDSYADGQNGPLDGMQYDKNCMFRPTTRWKIQRAKERGKQLEDF